MLKPSNTRRCMSFLLRTVNEKLWITKVRTKWDSIRNHSTVLLSILQLAVYLLPIMRQLFCFASYLVRIQIAQRAHSVSWNAVKYLQKKKKVKYSVKNAFRRKLKRRDTCARLVRNKAIPKPTGLHNVFSKKEAAWSESWRRDQSGTTGRVLKVNDFLIRLCTSRSLLLFKRVIDISAVWGPGLELSVSQSIQQIVLCLSFVCSCSFNNLFPQWTPHLFIPSSLMAKAF